MRACKIITTVAILSTVFGSAYAMTNTAWTKYSTGITEGKVKCLFVAAFPQTFILAGTDKAIYRAAHHNSSFVPVLQNHGNSLAINQIYHNAGLSSSIYSATDSGVFFSRDDGQTWSSIFLPANVLARQALCVVSDTKVIYVGTADGLYFRRQDGQVWQKEHREIGQKMVSHLASDGNYVYAATDSGIYRIEKAGEGIAEIYSLGSRLIEEEDWGDDQDVLSQQIKDMVVSEDRKEIFVATVKKIIFSRDQGATWQDISVQGLPVDALHALLSVNSKSGVKYLYAATDSGIYSYQNNYWKSDVDGVGNISTNDVVQDDQGNMYLASDDGIYIKSVMKVSTQEMAGRRIDYTNIALDFKQDPTIKDVQRMAVEYANVNPRQINSWHNQSRAKAFFPTWSLGLSRADSDIYHWDTGANPDVLTKGRDYVDWSTSLSWDFSDLVWSSDHTSIDSRSKLMSELRQDILDQVTRLYFERRRIQVELAATKEMTAETYLEKGIRLEELTALLDGLTGGEFSQRQEIKQNQ